MVTLYPTSFMSNSNWFVQESHRTEWTKEENKQFESALAIYDKDTPDRWLKVAAMIPGKTVLDVMKQYKELLEDVCEIEAGRVPIPGYLTPSFSFDFIDNQNNDAYRKKPATVRGSDQERKKGIPWTEDEHKRFLMGLLKYGKGDWRNIARNFVVTKTPTQVASHAQKYFIRQLSGVKEKRRPSIHDITIVNLTESVTSDNKPHVFNEPYLLPSQQNTTSTPKVQVKWNEHEVFNPNCDNLFLSSPSDFSTKALKRQGQDLYDCALQGAYADLKDEGFMTAPRDFNKAADFGIHAL